MEQERPLWEHEERQSGCSWTPKWKDRRDWVPTTAQKGLAARAHPPDGPAEVLYGEQKVSCDPLHIVRGMRFLNLCCLRSFTSLSVADFAAAPQERGGCHYPHLAVEHTGAQGDCAGL